MSAGKERRKVNMERTEIEKERRYKMNIGKVVRVRGIGK